MQQSSQFSATSVDVYMKYALSLTPTETKLIKSFNEWLPKTVIDSHAHSNTQAQCEFIDSSCLSHVCSTFPWFEAHQHLKIAKIFYPKKEFKILLFPMPFRGINHREANNYLLYQAEINPSIIPILYGLPDDIEYTLTQIQRGVFHGLKMYPAYFTPPAKRIYEYFPEKALQSCQATNLPIILHLPCPIVECKDELVAIIKRFPDLKIVIAHIGLMYFPTDGLQKSFSMIGKYSNVYLDTAMITSSLVLKMAFEAFGADRILFGTDQPINLVKGRIYKHPLSGARMITQYPYHWIDPNEQKEFSQQAKNVTHLHWEMLLALKETMESYKETKSIKNKVFSQNAQRVFGLDRFPKGA